MKSTIRVVPSPEGGWFWNADVTRPRNGVLYTLYEAHGHTFTRAGGRRAAERSIRKFYRYQKKVDTQSLRIETEL